MTDDAISEDQQWGRVTMRCERCRGTGKVLDGVWWHRQAVPCPDCGGCGLAHCCDGLTAANETPEPEPPAD